MSSAGAVIGTLRVKRPWYECMCGLIHVFAAAYRIYHKHLKQT